MVRRWDATTGALLAETPNGSAAATVVRGDGTTALAVGSPDGSILITTLPGADPR